jgi:hypothetical protein
MQALRGGAWVTQMLLENDVSHDPDAPRKDPRQRPRSALETELNKALDRLDHQVQDTKDYLARLDGQAPVGTPRKRRRSTDRKPPEDRER